MNHNHLLFDYFWGNIKKYSWNIFEKIFKIILKLKKIKLYHFIKVHVKNLAKNAVFKQIEIHLQVLFIT
jgi:hypothetical protein